MGKILWINIKLKGIHNYENICTCLTAIIDLIDIDKAIEVFKTFKGVEHRLEFVREINGVKWYNDSIGTSPSRTIAGLNSFDKKIVLIAGGYDKNLDYSPLAKPILEKVSKLVLFGNTTTKIYDAVVKELTKQDPTAVFPIYKHKSLEQVVNRAYKIAEPGEIVLFSPASASFDMFKNFEERGEKFKELVNSL